MAGLALKRIFIKVSLTCLKKRSEANLPLNGILKLECCPGHKE
jgi:hypothetical protein